MTSIPISAVRIDGGTQIRVAMSGVVVSDYTEALANGTKLPPITVFFDGEFHWLADGFHRHAAHVKNGSVEIDADVREGTKRDATSSLFMPTKRMVFGGRRPTSATRC